MTPSTCRTAELVKLWVVAIANADSTQLRTESIVGPVGLHDSRLESVGKAN